MLKNVNIYAKCSLRICVINRLHNRFVSHGEKNKIFRERPGVDPRGGGREASSLLYKMTQADRQTDRQTYPRRVR